MIRTSGFTIMGTEAEILALSGNSYIISAFTTDTGRHLMWNGSTWENAGVPFTAVTADDVSTGANVNPVDLTGLVWSYIANSIYTFKFYGEVLPAAATTGCGFQLNVSAAVTAINMAFFHQLANTGTLSGGSSRADDASVGVSSGMDSNATPTTIIGHGILRTGANAGTAQLRFRSETTAVTTAKAGFALIVEKVK